MLNLLFQTIFYFNFCFLNSIPHSICQKFVYVAWKFVFQMCIYITGVQANKLESFFYDQANCCSFISL